MQLTHCLASKTFCRRLGLAVTAPFSAAAVAAYVYQQGREDVGSCHRRRAPGRYAPRASRLGQASQLNCQAHKGSVTGSSNFVERLHSDTYALLARTDLGPAAPGCPIPDALKGLGATELAVLFVKVEALIASASQICDDPEFAPKSWGPAPLPGVVVAPTRAAWEELLIAVTEVEAAILGSSDVVARPISETRWWAPLILRWRYYVCSLFSWGLLPAAIVEEAGEELRKMGVVGIVDPLAGSGWHCRLWRDAGGFAAKGLDSYPVRPVAWADVAVVADSRDVLGWGIDESGAPGVDRWAMHLSWPPHAPETVGIDLLKGWQGKFVVYVGEQEAPGIGEQDADDVGLTGGRALLDELAQSWTLVKKWDIPRWPGFGDSLSVYQRRR